MRPRIVVPTLLAAIAAAQDAAPPTLVVVAEREAVDRERTPVVVEVVERADREAAGDPWKIADLLDGLPGVSATQTGGGPGGAVALFVRGARAHDTAVWIDGIPWRDVTDTQNRPDQVYLPVATADRLELAKGAQSGVYGSSAVGGVLGLTSARPTSAHEGRFAAEYGSFRTVRSTGRATGPLGGGAGYALAAEGLRTQGFSAQTDGSDRADPGGYEADGLQRGSVSARIEAQPATGVTIYGAAIVAAGRDESDDFGVPDDPETYKTSRAWRGALGASGKHGRMSWSADAAQTTTVRERPHAVGWNQPETTDRNQGDDRFVAVRGAAQVSDSTRLAFGADGRWSSFRQTIDTSPQAINRSDRNIGIYGQARWSRGSDELTAALRTDAHSRDGDATTGRAGAARFVWDGRTKLFANGGTGFRSPSLYELYDPTYGRTDLAPQRNRTMDAGQSTELLPGLDVTTTAFRTEWLQNIVYDSVTSRYANTGTRSYADGLESALSWKPEDGSLRAQLSATWLRSDDGKGKDLNYAPVQVFAADLRWKLSDAAGLRLGVRRTGKQYASSGENDQLPGRTIVDLAAAWQVTTHASLTARVENLTDERYDTYRGSGAAYAGAPRAGYVGGVVTW